ncbi:MAG: MFS transporter [Actinomycetia bacterium]|nr:MFS transporter [Actinomycetes bacterium]
MRVSAPDRSRDARAGLAIALAGSVALLGSLDSALNIAFPDLTDDFGLDVADIRWVVIAYVATYAVLLVGAGRVADLIGHRTVLVWGLMISVTGFLATAMAPSYGWLLPARVVQGVGVAAMLAAAPALITLTVSADRRGRALGVFQMSAALGLALGPLIGGVLVAAFGWRAVFWFRVPLSLLLVVVVAPHLRHFQAETGGIRRFELAPFRQFDFVLANVLNLMANAAMFGIWLLVPYYALDVLETGPVIGGLLLMVVPLVQAGSSPMAGFLGDRFGPGWVTSVGLVIEGLGLAGLSRLDSSSSALSVGGVLAAVGFGLSLFGVPNMSYVMGCIDRVHQGVAAGVSQMMRTSGIVIGVFAASAYFDGRRLSHAEQLLVDPDGPVSFVPAFQDTFVVATIVCAIAATASLLRALATSPDHL